MKNLSIIHLVTRRSLSKLTPELTKDAALLATAIINIKVSSFSELRRYVPLESPRFNNAMDELVSCGLLEDHTTFPTITWEEK